MGFNLEARDELIPAVPPPGGSPARTRPSTQVMVRKTDWPGNIFRLWLPENVGEYWSNWDGAAAHQDFAPTDDGGLVWRYEGHPAVILQAEIRPQKHALRLETWIINRSSALIRGARASHCLQLSQAPDFACGDFSRIYIHSGGQWQSLAALTPHTDCPHYFRAGAQAAAGLYDWESRLAHLNEPVEAGHPLMVCVSKDGQRSVGTASDDYRFLFHNRANAHLWCIHSQQSPAADLAPGAVAVFRQTVFFVEGGLMDCVAAYEAGRPGA